MSRFFDKLQKIKNQALNTYGESKILLTATFVHPNPKSKAMPLRIHYFFAKDVPTVIHHSRWKIYYLLSGVTEAWERDLYEEGIYQVDPAQRRRFGGFK